MEIYLFYGLIATTLVQWVVMFVMFYVRFKMFKIVDLFLIPMLVLQGLVICLFVFMKGKRCLV